MIIEDRKFFIPETKLDKQWCIKQNELTQLGVFVNNRQIMVYTNKENDGDIIRHHIKNHIEKYYFEAVSVKHSNIQLLTSDVIKSQIDVVVDIRINPNNNKLMSISTLKTTLNRQGVFYEWIPQLGNKDTRKIGKYKLDGLFRKYRRFVFIGNSKYVLDKLCKVITEYKSLITEEKDNDNIEA